jgi:type I restriction enzyme R subunit
MTTKVVGRHRAVIIDEAHSSASGEATKQLQGVLSGSEIAELETEATDSDEGVDRGTDVIAHSARARRPVTRCASAASALRLAG